ncbi:MAG: chemotaxis response regulator protein-glutamate methylesterase [Thermodesulfovibrio sp.]|nr:chemotaxis response regulator protein-glutamate methylesterase [Thermodesulfovibrio sp.]
MGTKKIKVLVVDDSLSVRETLKKILLSDPMIEAVETAEDGIDALNKVAQNLPDVITLDVEMPRMDGITFLGRLMTTHPVPVVMCSSVTAAGCATTLRALEYGALDIIKKPQVGTRQFLEEAKMRICDAVRAASMAKVHLLPRNRHAEPCYSADAVIGKAIHKPDLQNAGKVIVVGASTGGPEALRVFLGRLPQDAPGVVVVQHMPEGFTSSFATQLDGLCRMAVREARNGDTVSRGTILIAPGNYHLLLKSRGAGFYVELKDGQLVNRHKPSVDVLFRSSARYAGANAVGVILTGMGDDGARGLKEMREAGAVTLAQDEASCVVYGMPKEALHLGGVDAVVPLCSMASEVMQAVRMNR